MALGSLSKIGKGVTSLFKAKEASHARELSARFSDELNILDFGADPTGTESSDNALSEAKKRLEGTGGHIYFPKGKYSLSPFVVPKGVYLRGDGIAHSVFFNAGDFRGTSLLVETPDGGVSCDLQSNSSGCGLKSLSILHVGGNSPVAICRVSGVLYPLLDDVELEPLEEGRGAGLLLEHNSQFETLYGLFNKVKSIGCAYGLLHRGVANANTFIAPDFGGTVQAIYLTGKDNRVCSGETFIGGSVEMVYSEDLNHIFIPKSTGIIDYNFPVDVYAVVIANFEEGTNVTFEGTYWEIGKVPPSFSGDNGTHPVVPVILAGSSMKGLSIIGGMHCFLWDHNSTGTYFRTAQYRYYKSNSQVANLYRTSLGMTIPNNTLTPISFNQVPIDSDSIYYDASSSRFQIRESGTYMISGLFTVDAFTTSTDFLFLRVDSSDAEPNTQGANVKVQQGSQGQCSISTVLKVDTGDWFTLSIKQVSGNIQAMSLSVESNYVSIIKL